MVSARPVLGSGRSILLFAWHRNRHDLLTPSTDVNRSSNIKHDAHGPRRWKALSSIRRCICMSHSFQQIHFPYLCMIVSASNAANRHSGIPLIYTEMPQGDEKGQTARQASRMTTPLWMFFRQGWEHCRLLFDGLISGKHSTRHPTAAKGWELWGGREAYSLCECRMCFP